MVFPLFATAGLMSEKASNLQNPLAARDARGSGSHRLHDRSRLDRLDEGVELGDGSGELDGVGVLSDIDDAAAEDVGQTLHFLAILAGRADLDQHQLAL